MFTDVRRRRKKAGLLPETLVYTGKKREQIPNVTLFSYTPTNIQEKSDVTLAGCLSTRIENGTTWVSVIGLQNVELVKEVGTHFNLHPLVMEDILNTGQRAKMEVFDDYVFIVLKMVIWNDEKHNFTVEQVSIVFGANFLLTFQEQACNPIKAIQDNLRKSQGRVREHGPDYLTYTLIDTTVDQYFVVMDNFGESIEAVEELIISNPTQKNIHVLYKLKRQLFTFRKAVWPVREIVNHLLQIKGSLLSDFTIPYFRDVYDHCMQVIDTTETFRDMLGGMLDVYLSSLTNRINEVMKVLTIIATIFIPLTFIASIYGMNFTYMPELHYHWSYFTVLGIMAFLAILMLVYFRRKKWI